jgi:hypothetical protein
LQGQAARWAAEAFSGFTARNYLALLHVACSWLWLNEPVVAR